MENAGERAPETVYTTREIAQAAGVHVNTVRFYEQIGFLTAPKRRPNGYRVYTDLQLCQCLLVRRAMRAEVLQNGLRKQAVEIVRKCASRDDEAAIASAKAYLSMIRAEMESARAAAASVQKALTARADSDDTYRNRRDAARLLGVTCETLRTWERNGLLTVARRENGYRAYSAADMERLNIIRTLRCANYSLAAIYRLLAGLDAGARQNALTMLDTPAEGEEILSACDRLLFSLTKTEADALEMLRMLGEIQTNFSSLQ